MNIKETGSIHKDSEFAYSFKFRKNGGNFNDLWAMKSSARESLRDWLIAWIFSPKTADTCANACSEMIENCIKFSLVDSMSSVSILIQDTSIIIETVNKAVKEHRECLVTMLKAIEESGNPRAMFADKLLKSTKGKSHLGILKILMETRGTLQISEKQDFEFIRVRLEIASKNLE